MAGIIDAHHHCWQLSRPEVGWPTDDLREIYRDFSPAEFAAVAQPLGVVGTVLVQSQPNDRDSDYLLALADQSPLVQGVVAWVNMKAPGAPDRIRALARHPKLRGLRPMLQALKDDAWIDDPALAPAVEVMVAEDLTFDALVLTRHLPHLLRFARRYPALSVIVDHGAKPPIASGDREPWRSFMAALAALPNTSCKLSGLLTEAKPEQGLEDLRPWVDDLLTWFGPDRLLWGSDWPVVNLAADYGHWLDLTEVLLTGLDRPEREAVLAGTARRIYRLSC